MYRNVHRCILPTGSGRSSGNEHGQKTNAKGSPAPSSVDGPEDRGAPGLMGNQSTLEQDRRLQRDKVNRIFCLIEGFLVGLFLGDLHSGRIWRQINDRFIGK